MPENKKTNEVKLKTRADRFIIKRTNGFDMRKMKEFYLDKSRNSLEVRFDDGGASIKLKGTDSKHLVVALLSLASEIQRLEAKTHVGQLRADSNRVKASMERIKNAPGLDRP